LNLVALLLDLVCFEEDVFLFHGHLSFCNGALPCSVALSLALLAYRVGTIKRIVTVARTPMA
jgi:hypothetical protein